MNLLNRLMRRAWIGLALATVLQAAPPEPVKGAFTLVVLPDTQFYAASYPETYRVQGRWIAANAQRYAVRHVLHVGDVTDNNNEAEWAVAREAHALFTDVVPCVLVPGNHDFGPGGKTSTRDTLLTETFPVTEARRGATFGGTYDREPTRMENTFYLFEAGDRRWIVVALEFGPRDDVVRWANEVVQRHADRSAILLTHAYLRPDNTRFDRQVPDTNPKAKSPNKGIDHVAVSKSPEGFNDGEDLWRKLVSPNGNFVLTISGHQGIAGHLESVGAKGQRVQQVVVDYQGIANGGNGFLRLLQFLPDGRTVRVNDYSPLLDETTTDARSSYDFTLSSAPSSR
ncbi:metallophosphoesterase [Oleiharenicola lentus]|uniref:metallophosphoesterase n=1 Tax=Oleiharenicola lentus TaxID=2508720 RepID=UPI003F67858A